MVRRPPTPRTPAEEYAAATYNLLGELVSAVGELTGMLRDRLPVAGPVRLTEPDPPSPALAEKPMRLTEPATTPPPAPKVEPDPEPAAEPKRRDLPSPPPRAGRGSGLDPWRAFADATEVRYGLDDKRDDIIARCEQAGVIPAQEV